MYPGSREQSPWPTCGTIDGEPDIQTPSRRSTAREGVLAFGGELGCYESSKQQEEVD